MCVGGGGGGWGDGNEIMNNFRNPNAVKFC